MWIVSSNYYGELTRSCLRLKKQLLSTESTGCSLCLFELESLLLFLWNFSSSGHLYFSLCLYFCRFVQRQSIPSAAYFDFAEEGCWAKMLTCADDSFNAFRKLIKHLISLSKWILKSETNLGLWPTAEAEI